MKLEQRTVLITGASRGIGEAAAWAFADYPVRLVLLARDNGRLQQVAGALQARSNAEVLAVVADVSKAEDVQSAVAEALASFGSIDILINNAGVGMRSPIGAIDLVTARAVFEVNFWGAIQCIQAVLPTMRAQQDGLIINISSIIGRRAVPATSIYCASKFALNALSEAIRVELMPDHIRVVSFYPGVTATDFNKHELSGDTSSHHRNQMPRTPAAKVGKAIVRAAQREPRDAYATWFDRLLVFGALTVPWLVDLAFSRFYRPAAIS